MCIIINSQASNLRRVLRQYPALVESIYDSNSDGLGLMWSDGPGRPHAEKFLPKDVESARAFLDRTLPWDEREVTLHARYTTHGKTDLDNCHPYDLDGGYLMHNGVLSCGNAADPSRSDTWHYCRDFLDGAADALLLNPQGRHLVGDHIGRSNRFVYLSPSGETVIVNRSTGVEYEGLWFSNTYAWDVAILDPTWVTHRWGGAFGKPGKGDPRVCVPAGWEAGFGLLEEQTYRDYGSVAASPLEEWSDESDSLVWLLSAGEETLAQALADCGIDLVYTIADEVGEPFVNDAELRYGSYAHTELTEFERACFVLEEMNRAGLNDLLRRDLHLTLAEAMTYGVDWGREPQWAGSDQYKLAKAA